MTVVTIATLPTLLGGPIVRGLVTVFYRVGYVTYSGDEDGAPSFPLRTEVGIKDSALVGSLVATPTGSVCYACITVWDQVSGRSVSRNVTVPDAETVDWADPELVDVDPVTFAPVDPNPPSMQDVLAAAESAVSDAAAKAALAGSSAFSAGASAAAAQGSEEAAQGFATNAAAAVASIGESVVVAVAGAVPGAVAADVASRDLPTNAEVGREYVPAVPLCLARYYQALSARRSAHVTAVDIGHSYVFGTGANTTTRYMTVMAFAQQQALLGAQQGYHVLAVDNGWTFAGTTGQPARGLSGRSVSLSAAATMSRTSGDGCDGFTVYFEQGPSSGNFTVTIDGGSPVTVTTNKTGVDLRHDGEWQSAALTPGDHTILITGTTGTVISGIYVHKGDRAAGIQWFNSGRSGTTTNDWLAVDGLNQRLVSLNPALVMIHLLRNDYAAQMPLATLRANLLAIMGNIHTAVPNAAILVLGQNKSELPVSPTIPWQDYLDTARAAVAEREAYAGFLDISRLFPESLAADTYGVLDADQIHLSVRGHGLMADAIGPILIPTGRLAYGTPYTPPPVVGELVCTVNPAITGTARVGSTLTSSTGTWTPIPSGFTFQWYRGASAISGATGSTYTLVSGDLDQAVSVRVTASLVTYTPVTASSGSVTVLPTAIPGAITSDEFSGPNVTTFAGRYTDARLGGAPVLWEASNAAAFGITNGVLVGGSNTTAGSIFALMTVADYELGVRVGVLPPSNTSIEVRTTSKSTSTSFKYRVAFGASGVSLRRVEGSANNTLSSSFVVATGDWVSVRIHGDQLSLLINGVVVATVTDSVITGPGYATITKAASSDPGFTDMYVLAA